MKKGINKDDILFVILILIIIYFVFQTYFVGILIVSGLLFGGYNNKVKSVIIELTTGRFEIYNKVLGEHQEDIKRGEFEISQYSNSPERKVKTIEELSKFFILGYESGKGREHYTVDNIRLKEDAHGNIEFVKMDKT